ncbi:leucine-rich repeat protein (LRRP) [Trypanosoma rangeli]|uniref:Leucine-rich repeat protein (LRRP) n=1 Tax=Trypanosoma rangeli TaxID=5698 RepID=A0A422NXA1_TRYRA|nr:leucine-rich repeat protein (LRRP) [Trypanosoma rangeli]RNF10107.1 leucine-rich repeat protein (LRRP) [Trypanosoma rangeli]|eukprot:RNF10107.1 leucine-rich repeat protein (LRRP) [Trypanosoma rangeli]
MCFYLWYSFYEGHGAPPGAEAAQLRHHRSCHRGCWHHPALTHLDLAGCFLVTSLNSLGSLKRLVWMNASWCGVRDGGMEGLSRCKNLEHLSLSHSWDICGANALGGLQMLQVLDLRGTNVDDEGIAGLARCVHR